jgi:hypothetical protein
MDVRQKELPQCRIGISLPSVHQRLQRIHRRAKGGRRRGSNVPVGGPQCRSIGRLGRLTGEHIRYCTNCGAELPSGAEFCIECGIRDESAVVAETEPVLKAMVSVGVELTPSLKTVGYGQCASVRAGCIESDGPTSRTGGANTAGRRRYRGESQGS